MYATGKKKGMVRFSLKPPPGVRSVSVAGDFNGWSPALMRKQKGGQFSAVLSVPPGTHEYKFVADGEWIIDPDNNAWAMNPYGTLNSVAHV